MANESPEVPPVGTAKTPKERTGLENAHKFKSYIENGLKTKSLPLNKGLLNRSVAAEENEFGRSAFLQNSWIKDIANWADTMLGSAPRNNSEKGNKTSLERELSQENQRLKDRNIVLKVELEDIKKKLCKFVFMEKVIDSGDVRLPW